MKYKQKSQIFRVFRRQILFDKSIFDLIRGLSPYPAAWTLLNLKVLKIFEAEIVNDVTGLTEYCYENNSIKLYTDHKKVIVFKAADGYLNVINLQLEGKKRMTIQEFLRGYKFK